MENNPYVKQYPDLMAGKKILYVHGFGSSARSGTVKRIQDTFPQATVIAHCCAACARKSSLISSSALPWAACIPKCSMDMTAFA